MLKRLAFCAALLLAMPAPPIRAQVAVLCTASQLDVLLAPYALYPDPLLACVLPACAFPTQLLAAQTYVRANGLRDLDSQPWDGSVIAVAHYPTVLNVLCRNLGGTDVIGRAFVNQQSDVLGSIQRLRAEAYSAGNLVSDVQEQVADDGQYVTIFPESDAELWVPEYDSLYTYQRDYRGPGRRISFGPHCRTGAWLHCGIDWIGHCVIYYPSGLYWGIHGRPAAWRGSNHQVIHVNDPKYVHSVYNSGNRSVNQMAALRFKPSASAATRSDGRPSLSHSPAPHQTMPFVTDQTFQASKKGRPEGAGTSSLTSTPPPQARPPLGPTPQVGPLQGESNVQAQARTSFSQAADERSFNAPPRVNEPSRQSSFRPEPSSGSFAASGRGESRSSAGESSHGRVEESRGGGEGRGGGGGSHDSGGSGGSQSSGEGRSGGGRR
jgi:uncharacterized membrane protein YgcG